MTDSERKGTLTLDELKKKYKENVSLIHNDDLIFNRENREVTNKLESVIKRLNRFKNINNTFIQIIELLNEINNSIFKKVIQPGSRKLFEFRVDLENRCKNKVYLSYAFVDMLYTFSLLCDMVKKEIFLYVDWLFAPEFNNRVDIERNLYIELLDSNQLLFLRSAKSELRSELSIDIRDWCLWELGVFYSAKKFALNCKTIFVFLDCFNHRRFNHI